MLDSTHDIPLILRWVLMGHAVRPGGRDLCFCDLL